MGKFINVVLEIVDGEFGEVVELFRVMVKEIEELKNKMLVESIEVDLVKLKV